MFEDKNGRALKSCDRMWAAARARRSQVAGVASRESPRASLRCRYTVVGGAVTHRELFVSACANAGCTSSSA